MNVHVSALDFIKLAKIVSLMMRGATDGERAAARNRVTAIAERAGMALDTALYILNSRLSMSGGTSYPWADLMEATKPGWKAEQARIKAEEEGRAAKRRAEVLERYGSEEALVARCEWERLLEASVEPIATFNSWTDKAGVEHWFASTLDGVKPCGGYWSLRDMTPRLRKTIVSAYPFPTTLAAALDELVFWKELDPLGGSRMPDRTGQGHAAE